MINVLSLFDSASPRRFLFSLRIFLFNYLRIFLVLLVIPILFLIFLFIFLLILVIIIFFPASLFSLSDHGLAYGLLSTADKFIVLSAGVSTIFSICMFRGLLIFVVVSMKVR